MTTVMSESEAISFFEINGWKVHFEKIGYGPNVILLIPGPIGTGRTDFEELLDEEEGLDFNQFTVIAVDPPGYGRSRPPFRKYGADVYKNDSECYQGVMQYSIIGFSEGSRVALLMAINYPQSITSIVLSALKTYSSNKGLGALLSNKTVDKWSRQKLDEYLKVYESKDEIQKLWNRYLKFEEFYHQYFPQDMFKSKYHLVKCPVLLTHGDKVMLISQLKDPLIELEQTLGVSQQLTNAFLHRFPYGEHESHRQYAPLYLKLVQDHILNLKNYNELTEEEKVSPNGHRFF